MVEPVEPAQPGVNLSHQDLRGANLAGYDLRHAALVRTDLSSANLEGADLEGAILQGAVLRQANLTRVNLVSAYMPWADLSGALLDHADLSHAILDSAILAGASLMGTRLADISYTRATLWPAGFKPYVHLLPSTDVVENLDNLLDYLTALARSRAIDADDSLETYLRSLKALIELMPAEPPTTRQIAQLFTDAFDVEPPDVSDTHVDARVQADEVFAPVKRELEEQIAELHQYVGTKAVSVDWANLSPEDYLAAAARGYDAHTRSLDATVISWQAVATVLKLGKCYE